MINIQENILLSKYTTFRLGGPAKYFAEVSAAEELIEVLEYAKKNNLEYFILGGGSNLLVSDKGFSGIAIRMKLNRFEIAGGNIEAESGVALSKAVNFSIKDDLAGLEWAAGIPGTIGGAVRGNAGAFDGDMSEVVESVKVLDTKKCILLEIETQNSKIKMPARQCHSLAGGQNDNVKFKIFKNKECEFSYRNSIFKRNKNLIILSATLKLQKGNKEESQKIVTEIIEQRLAKQPIGISSAGSFFVNPTVENKKIVKEFEEETGKKCKAGKIPAPWLIEKAGLKGKKIGGAVISEMHANYICNTGSATAEDVIILVSYVKQQIRDKFGVQLKEEVQLIGFD